MKTRLDQMLVTRGLAPTRSQARDLVTRGLVRIAGETARKAGLDVDETAVIEVAEGAQPYVSRGGLKLAAALDAFSFSPLDRVALDAGASTGGFVDVLLRRGAARVYAVDVGSGQLHPSIAADARVVSLENFDVRTLTPDRIPEPVEALTADLSFISLTAALSPVLALAAPNAWLAALVKPQFEAGRAAIGKGGIVKDAVAREAAVRRVADWLEALPDWRLTGVITSPIAGGAGNVEFLIGAQRRG